MMPPGLEWPDYKVAYGKQRQAVIQAAEALKDAGLPYDDWARVLEADTPEAFNLALRQLENEALAASGKLGDVLSKRAQARMGMGAEYGNINPGDYTPESFARFMEAGGGLQNIGLLERYAAPQIVDIGGVPHRVSRSGNGQIVATPVPLSDLPTETEGAGAISGAQAEAAQEATQNVEAGLGDAPSKAEIAADVTAATEGAKAESERKQLAEKNAKAYKTWEVARDNLMSALQETMTGWAAGVLPDITAAQQVAENAQRIAFPAVKALVREAGEGVFTDRDAADIQAMLPTRSTTREAVPMVMWQIDAYIAAKLGQPVPPRPGAQQGELTPEEQQELEELRKLRDAGQI